MKKKSLKLGRYVVVPNSSGKKKRAAKKTSSGVKASEVKLLDQIYKQNLSSKQYDVASDGVVVVREKESGRVLSKFQVPGASKKASLRKLDLKPSPGGTIAIKKILDSI